jgi:hypothetical protein
MIKTCDLNECGKKFTSKHPSQRFCCLKHKDQYHNVNNPRGKFAHLADEGIHEDWPSGDLGDAGDLLDCGDR